MFSTPKISQNQNPEVYNIEELTPDIANETNLGRKGASLFALHSFDVPVPEFFVIPPSIFSNFVKKILDEKGEELLKKNNPEPREITSIFHRYDFENSVKTELLKEYTKLSGFSDAWVSVRSSVSAPLYPEVSFSGVFSTQLNIRGFNNLLKSIKDIYASLFTDSAVMYAVREGVELADVKLAVVVQKMVHAEISGTCFTLDPVTLNTDRMSIEAVYGLGDVIANGEITPDSYSLHKKNLEVYEKHIAPQEWMRVRSLSSQSGGFEKINISPNWSHKQKLEEKYIREIAKISLLIEDKRNDHVDVEWVISGGRVYVLQFKHAYSKESYLNHHVQFGGYSYVANTIGGVIKDLMSRNVQIEQVMENTLVAVTKLANEDKKETKINEEKKEEKKAQPAIQALTSGIGVSFGKANGLVHILKDVLDEVSKKNVLIIDEYSSILSSVVMKSSGVIATKGGLTSELSILCREFGIPAVVGVSSALEVLKENDEVELDGNTGSVYMINKAKVEEIEVAKEMISKKIDFVTSKQESKIEEVKSEQKLDPIQYIHTATKVYSDGVDMQFVQGSDGIVFIDLDRILIQFGKHPTEVLKNAGYKKYAQEILKPIINIAQNSLPSEVVLAFGKGDSDDFEKIAKKDSTEIRDGKYPLNGTARYLKNIDCLEVVVRLIKRLRNIHNLRNISLGVYAPQSGMLMKEIKKEISARGLRRGSSFNIYAIVENPSEVILSDDILDAEIDGIVVDTTTLAKRIFNLPLNHKDVVYDLSAGSVQKVLDSVIGSTKKYGKKSIILCEDNKDLLKYCVSKGVFGVIVKSQYIQNAKKLVSEQEAKIILSVK